MKKVKLLILPLVGLLLNSCASTIKGSELPELKRDPGHLLKLKLTISGSGDKHLLDQLHYSQEKTEVLFEFYTNFLITNSIKTVDNKKSSQVDYYMLKNKVIYFLHDDDGEKSKTEEKDPNGEYFKSLADDIMTTAYGYVDGGEYVYEEMVNVEKLKKEAPENTTIQLKQLGYIYILTKTNEEGGEKTKFVYKLTIKNDYFTAFEAIQEYSKENKKATIKMGFKCTFGAEEATYDESSMPNPAHYAAD